MKTMSKKVLVVVDMQKDFIDGSLGTKEAVGIVEKVADKIKGFDGEIVFTRDTHFENYLDTQEGKNLPVKHCIKDTEGWQINKQLETLRTPQMKVFDKLTFGSVELAEYLKAQSDLESVELVGLCTDICVISNAMVIKAFLPELPICVDSSCCAGVTPESHLRAIEAMKMCQITIL
jgi:nicotinamidase-related amidase